MTAKNIEKLREQIDQKFSDGGDYDSLFFDLICHDGKFLTDKELSIFDKLCDTKEHADIFFRCYKSVEDFNKQSYLISHWVYEQPEPYRSKRCDAWHQVQEKLGEIVKKYYNVEKWGEQDKLVPARNEKDFSNLVKEEITTEYDPELMDKDKYIKKFAKNRPVYVNGIFMGYCKSVCKGQLSYGYSRYYDSEDYRYYTNDDYYYTTRIKFHESIETVFSRVTGHKRKLKDLFLKSMTKGIETSGSEYDEEAKCYVTNMRNNPKSSQPISTIDRYVMRGHPTTLFAGSSYYNREDGLHIQNIDCITITNEKIIVTLPQDKYIGKNEVEFNDCSFLGKRRW